MDMNTNNGVPHVTEQHTENSYAAETIAHHQASSSHHKKKTAASSKLKVHKGAKTTAKKIKFHSASCGDAAQQEIAYHKLDGSVPQHAHKMQQRRKAIAKGKNTIGYEIYCQQVLKHQRRKRSMDTPSTPDHTLDVPNKKWNGMVRAWRIALHKYDPKDLQESFAELQECTEAEKALEASDKNNGPKTVKEQELEQAKSSGLLDLVQLGSTLKNDATSPPPRLSQSDVSMDVEELSPAAGATSNHDMSELDQWESARGNDDDCFGIDTIGDESDDDLL